MNKLIHLCILGLLGAISGTLPARAADRLIRVDTRPGVTVPVYLMKREGATATVALLPGGNGGFGTIADGQPSSANFLVRSRDHFADAGLNVAVVGRPSDTKDLDYADRISPEHMVDLKKVVDYLYADTPLPVWLVGTSRGTVSATAAAVSFGDGNLAGIVLTSSVVSYRKIGAVPTQDLAAIRIPTLIVHHEQDGCKICLPHEVPAILSGLKNAPFKKLQMISGGANPTGDPCEALHFHGYIGMEKETVGLIAAWIRKPSN